MMCQENSLGNVAGDGGKLIVYSDDIEVIIVDVPKPYFGAENSSDSATYNDENFYDDFENEYKVEVISEMTGIYYSIEAVEIKNEKEIKNFCSSLKVEYEDNEINPYEDENSNFLENVNSILPKENFFSLRLSKKEGIGELVSFYRNKDVKSIFKVEGLTHHKNIITRGSIVFITAGGDKGQMGFEYTQGLYGIGKVVDEPYQITGKSYAINLVFIYFFNHVIQRKEFSPYQNTEDTPFIAMMSKGEKTQAVSHLSNQQFMAVLDASVEITNTPKNELYVLFPWLKEEFKSIAVKDYNLLMDDMPPGLNIENIAKAFSAYLTNYSSDQTSTLVGIFGKWGRGKTYFYDKVKDSIQLDTNKEKTFYFCKFQPWKYQKQESAWAYLYETLLHGYMEKNRKFPDTEYKETESILKYYGNYIKEYLKELRAKFKLNVRRVGYSPLIGYVLTISISAFWIFSSLSFKLSSIGWLSGILGFGGIVYLYKTYSFVIKNKQSALYLMETYGKTKDYTNHLGFQNEIEKEITFLLEEYIDQSKERLVLFIDDLDRCDEQMIINILDGLRLVLDNPSINSRLTIITAIDEEILSKAIEHKYFHENINPEVDSEKYIEKFFLLGIKLTQLQENDIEELVDLYTEKLNNLIEEPIKEPVQTIKRWTLSNPDLPPKILKKFVDVMNKLNGPIKINDQAEKVTVQTARVNKNNLKSSQKGLSDKIMNKNEIQSIKKFLMNDNKILQLTPRKINIIIHRYLLLKALIFTVMSEQTYQNLKESELVKLLINSQNEKGLKKYLQHYLDHKTPKIQNILSSSETDVIDRNDFIMLVMFAEMVSPF